MDRWNILTLLKIYKRQKSSKILILSWNVLRLLWIFRKIWKARKVQHFLELSKVSWIFLELSGKCEKCFDIFNSKRFWKILKHSRKIEKFLKDTLLNFLQCYQTFLNLNKNSNSWKWSKIRYYLEHSEMFWHFLKLSGKIEKFLEISVTFLSFFVF